jgi:hypothetical protein
MQDFVVELAEVLTELIAVICLMVLDFVLAPAMEVGKKDYSSLGSLSQ